MSIFTKSLFLEISSVLVSYEDVLLCTTLQMSLEISRNY